MNRRYIPILILGVIFLAYLLFKDKNGKDQDVITENQGETVFFERDTTNLVYSRHALCRMDCRNVDESEVKEILLSGRVNTSRIERNSKGVTYPLEGETHDGQNVRIVVAPKKQRIVVVTVIDLDKEWQCDCN